jgi:putative hydrolase of the HAD superfamily
MKQYGKPAARATGGNHAMAANGIFDTRSWDTLRFEALLFDADDTLWENNIYFLRAIEEFVALLAPVAPDPREVERVLTEVEHEYIPVRGYGSRNFIDALHEVFRRLHSGIDTRAGAQTFSLAIEAIGERLLRHPVEPMPGVAMTLAALSERHRLLCFTKGDREEQSEKLERSGLRVYFERIEVVEEKDTPAYQKLIRRRALKPETTVMIGNSPVSDILPALAAGLWAVFIPHPHTWHREDGSVDPHHRLIVTQSFSELPQVLSAVRVRTNFLHQE